MHEPDTDEPGACPDRLTKLCKQHGRVMILVTAITLAAFIVTMELSAGPIRARIISAFGVQMIVMAVVMPVAAHRANGALAVLFRAGVSIDAFGLALLVLAILSPELSIWQAIKAYLLAGAAGLLMLGVAVWVRTTRMPRLAGSATAAVIGTTIACALFFATGRLDPSSHPDEPRDAFRMLANADLHAALENALDLRAPKPPWLRVTCVYLAAAALAWMAPLLRRSTYPPS